MWFFLVTHNSEPITLSVAKFNIIIPPQDIQQNPGCLQKIAQGDRKSYEWLYKNYYNKIYEYALLLTADQHTSDDIVQEIFLKIWKQKENLAEIENFNGWIHSAAKNLITDTWRKRATEKQVLKNIAHTIEIKTYSTPFKNEPTILTHAINALSERQQLIYRLVREEGKNREEISEALKISPNTVKATMQNALNSLRKTLTVNG
jgi:RNA polymerase sigma-70 factor (ECF subfamily)